MSLCPKWQPASKATRARVTPVPTKNLFRRRLGDVCFTIVIGEGPGFLGVRGRGNKVDEISWYEVFGRDRADGQEPSNSRTDEIAS